MIFRTPPLYTQVDREDADITAWDSNCPDMSEHNSRDCAALVSLTVEKQLAAKYRDMQCLLPVEEIQVLEVVGWKDLMMESKFDV